MQSKQHTRIITLSLCLLAIGCGDGGARSHKVPWGDGRAEVISTDRTISTFAPIAGDGCLDYEGASKDVCIRPQDVCGEEAADVILDERGEVLDVICYPNEETVTVDEIEAEQGNIAQSDNNAVLVLDDVDDGIDLEGNLDVDANNVVIYGAGPDVSVISGDVTVDGNNTLIRGVRIQGDVNVVKNDSVFVYCVIEGNLTISANNTQLLGCDVFGDIRITGNNTELAADRIAGKIENDGKNLSCDSNRSFEDRDENMTVSDEELGETIECGVKKD